MSRPDPFGLGIIEGFYGRTWSWADRESYANFLKELKFDFFIYAPKADPYLRKRWRENWPASEGRRLAYTVNVYRTAKLSFGVGLSPFEIHADFGASSRRALRNKIAQLNEIGADMLCILFDDMRGDMPGLAKAQAQILAEVTEYSTAKAFAMCPTYYSSDPKLERIFGKAPDAYWADLGCLLDPRIAVFWTGPRVCSTVYPREHLAEITDLLRRKPFLWDNGLANDGAESSNRLHLAVNETGFAELGDRVSGHAVNPMNQAWLSRIPLLILADSYDDATPFDPDRSFAAACQSRCGEDLAEEIARDLDLFQTLGLSAIAEDVRHDLIRKYGRFDGNPYAGELVAWLQKEYKFDPACLTD